ncbi:MAG: hypothetical protein L0Z70_04985 [Chloroflexi bacterium]|nr:hypothetical protein [Chloroflexota bacterium]
MRRLILPRLDQIGDQGSPFRDVFSYSLLCDFHGLVERDQADGAIFEAQHDFIASLDL